MLYQKEKNKILVDFNKSEMDYPEEKSLVDLFKLKVYNNPLNIAIEQNGKKLTYKDLDEKSNTICLNILNNKNIPKNSIIGVFMNKSIELVILIWGILKAGHSYVIMQKLNYIDYSSATAIALVMLIISFLILLIINIIQMRVAKRTS